MTLHKSLKNRYTSLGNSKITGMNIYRKWIASFIQYFFFFSIFHPQYFSVDFFLLFFLYTIFFIYQCFSLSISASSPNIGGGVVVLLLMQPLSSYFFFFILFFFYSRPRLSPFSYYISLSLDPATILYTHCSFYISHSLPWFDPLSHSRLLSHVDEHPTPTINARKSSCDMNALCARRFYRIFPSAENSSVCSSFTSMYMYIQNMCMNTWKYIYMYYIQIYILYNIFIL